MGQKQTELGEGDWMTIAEAAYKAHWEQVMATHPNHRTPLAWSDESRAKQQGWVVAVKATAEMLRKWRGLF